jgi:hypothetical protein
VVPAPVVPELVVPVVVPDVVPCVVEPLFVPVVVVGLVCATAQVIVKADNNTAVEINTFFITLL